MLEACNSVCIIWWLDSGRFLILTYISTYWCCYKIGRYLIGIDFMYFYLHYFIAILRRQLHWLHGKIYDVWLVHSAILVLYHKYIPTYMFLKTEQFCGSIQNHVERTQSPTSHLGSRYILCLSMARLWSCLSQVYLIEKLDSSFVSHQLKNIKARFYNCLIFWQGSL